MSNEYGAAPERSRMTSKSEAELRRGWAEEAIDFPLRKMAANILRIVRGAGKAEELLANLKQVIDSAVAYREAVGHWPPQTLIAKILRINDGTERFENMAKRGEISQEELNRLEHNGLFAQMRAEYRICRGALQIAASELIDQSTQKLTGQTEMYDGVNDLDVARQLRASESHCSQSS